MRVLRKTIAVLVLVLGLWAPVWAQGEESNGRTYTISGVIHFEKEGNLYLALVTEEEFKQGKVGRFSQIIVLTSEASREKKVGFEFNGVPAGTYGLECFQDVNGNGKMDFFLMIPLEPWGMYRPARPLMRAPRFSEIAFVVASDLSDIEFEVK